MGMWQLNLLRVLVTALLACCGQAASSEVVIGGPGDPFAWEGPSGKFSVLIHGMPAQKECWTAVSPIGVEATLSGGKDVVVYDSEDTSCGDGGAFIHFADNSMFVPMTPDSGAVVHKYIAGVSTAK